MSVDNYGHRYLSDQDGETEDINGYMDSRPGSSILLQEHRLSDLIPECYAATSDKQDADGTNRDPPTRPTSPMVVVPEGGYGWVVVGAAFLCSFVVDGVANAFGMYLIEFTDLYGEPEAVTSWIGSLLVGVYLCMGPIACGLADSFGYRTVIASGSLIAAIGFVSSYFVTNVHLLFLTFGVVGGIGFGLIYSPSIMCVCSYFKEQSALAVGISVCGSSVGGMVFPNIVQLLLDHFGWQGSMLFLAGASLQCCIAAAVMRNPIHKVIALKNPSKEVCLPPLLRQAIVDMASLEVYRIPTFLIYSLASFIGSIAFLTPSFYLPSFAIEKYQDLDKDTAATVITAICGAGIFGRIFWGGLADRPNCDALVIHNVCILTSGITLALMPLCTSFSQLIVAGVVYGFFIAPYISLMSTILTTRIGMDQLPSAFGQTQLIAGIASMIGPPIHGTLEGATTMEMPFYCAGIAWILAAIVASLILLLPAEPKKRACATPNGVNGDAIYANAKWTEVPLS